MHPLVQSVTEKGGDGPPLSLRVIGKDNDRLGAVEYGNGAAAVVLLPVCIGGRTWHQPIGRLADLVRGAIVDVERHGPTLHVHAQCLP